MMETMTKDDFTRTFKIVAEEVQEVARKNGFNEDPVNVGESIALMHSELSEALEAVRHGNPPDDKCPEFDSMTVELADAVIRIMHFSERMSLPLAEAILAKHEFNKTRPYKHGKKF